MSVASGIARVIGAGAVTGAACLAYAAGHEVRNFALRRHRVPVLEPGQRAIKVLHISDMHLTPRRRETVEWVLGLAALRPDVVVNTGDNLAAVEAAPVALEALDPLFDVPGVFVMGSNDYHAPRPSNPAMYLFRPSNEKEVGQRIDTESFAATLRDLGWTDLNNRRMTLEVDGRMIEFVGVDDPHIGRDEYDGLPANEAADLTIGVAHAPYLRVLDAMTADGVDLLMMGHTHGGQVNLPLYGPLVSNCDLPPRYAKGLHTWHAGGQSAWLNVSAGLGTSPYTAFRLACRPEATLLTLVPRD